MSSRRITRSQTKTATSPVRLEALPPRPRHADLAVQRQRAKTLPARRRLATEAADNKAATNSYKHDAFQQADGEADLVELDGEEEEEDEGEEDGEYEDHWEDEQEQSEEEERDAGGRSHHQRVPATARHRSAESRQPAAPSSQSLFGQLLPFVWKVLKISIIVSLLAMLAAPLVLVSLHPSLMTSPLNSISGHSFLSTLRTAVSSVTGLFAQPASSTTIARSVHSNLSTIIDNLSKSHPAYASPLRRTIQPSLDDHFDLSIQHSNRPLVLFIAHPPAMPVSALQSFAYDLSSQLYPASVPSYLLDLTDIASQKHFDGPHLESLLDTHFAAHNDGLVLLPSLTTLQHSRSVGETLQHWLDDDRAPAKRAVFILGAAIDLQAAKKTDESDKLGASRERQVVHERLKLALHEKGDGKREDELVDAILSRVVRNLVVLK